MQVFVFCFYFQHIKFISVNMTRDDDYQCLSKNSNDFLSRFYLKYTQNSEIIMKSHKVKVMLNPVKRNFK